MVYSPTLRPHSAGFIGIGSLPTLDVLNITSNLVIPPGQVSQSREGGMGTACVPACLIGLAGCLFMIWMIMTWMGGWWLGGGSRRSTGGRCARPAA